MIKKLFFILFIIIISGLSGVFTDRYLFPRLAATKLFSKYEFLKKSTEDVTIINKTEQVYVKEEYSISKFTNQNPSAIVNILSYPDPKIISSELKKSLLSSEVPFKNRTGVIVTSDGIIMTYAPAIAEGTYKITTTDGNIYDGKLIGIDSWSNLVFIKIEASNLPVVSFGNSDEFELGEKLIAIGNNMKEYQNKYFAGVLSSYDPTFNISGEVFSRAEKIEGAFLADFNSEKISAGDPIIDYSGQVIGIMGATERNGKIQYFEIPSNKVKKSLEKAINNQLDLNPVLGAYYISISKSYALANKLKIDHGAMIYSSSGQQGLAVIAGTPAAKAELKINDIIVKINDEEVNLNNNLSDILYKYKKGDLIKGIILRNNEEKEISIQL